MSAPLFVSIIFKKLLFLWDVTNTSLFTECTNLKQSWLLHKYTSDAICDLIICSELRSDCHYQYLDVSPPKKLLILQY